MPEVFINYRTGDGDRTAALIDTELSHRFGGNSTFRASKSISPGAQYPTELLRGVRRSTLLLAVIGPRWAYAPELEDSEDWVRREILEAFECGIPVVPVIEGRRTDRLNRDGLSPELARLAEVQSVRLDMQSAAADLERLGDLVAAMVPSLKSADRRGPAVKDAGAVNNSVGDISGTAVQSRDITGDVGTVIKGNSGAVHTGTGDLYNNSRHVSGGQHFSGDGATYVEGGIQGGVNHSFGRSRRREDDER
ncbi:toll/interleukin-1 receptor domain-containing protein [Streptomyces sp. NPDC057908]|uniref:toll/interleukin-1 receptor domain-containing protein n=1 Tax=Streptomyces sp. NPDC057908 TaxID=3346276 RepID=UPI0036E23E06